MTSIEFTPPADSGGRLLRISYPPEKSGSLSGHLFIDISRVDEKKGLTDNQKKALKITGVVLGILIIALGVTILTAKGPLASSLGFIGPKGAIAFLALGSIITVLALGTSILNTKYKEYLDNIFKEKINAEDWKDLHKYLHCKERIRVLQEDGQYSSVGKPDVGSLAWLAKDLPD